MIILSADHAAYPQRLRDLPQPPDPLHVRGDDRAGVLTALPTLPAVAIVGAREAGNASTAFARTLAGDLAAAGVAVISGLARGIDAAAHAGALAADGTTVAVLGCGVDRDYPAATAALAARIAADGLVVSEYPPGTPPARFRFPERNRIVAALADVVVVVAAARRSGALITARIGMELGREVMVVPGAPWERLTEGGNALLRDGALLVTEVADVLIALGVDPGRVRAADPTVSSAAARVLGALRREAASPELLAARCGLGPGAAAAALAELEMQGLVVRELDGRVVPTRSGRP